MNKYNYMHFNDGVRMRCGSDCSENEIVCPYYQQTYGTCFYDGECSGFLKKAADLLEKD